MLGVAAIVYIAVRGLLLGNFQRLQSQRFSQSRIFYACTFTVLVVLLCFMLWAYWPNSMCFFFSLNSWSSVTGAWVEAGCGRQGSWLGVAGRARGWVVERSCYLGLGSAAPVPGFLDTQPPCATRAFKILPVAAKLA